MAKKKKKIPDKLQIWIDARKRYHLSHAHIQMARELGLNPKKFGKLSNTKQEPWKASPFLGEANRYVYQKLLGLSEHEIRSYMNKGIIA